METEGRTVIVPIGSSVTLACRVKSERDGVAIHYWQLPPHLSMNSPGISQSRLMKNVSDPSGRKYDYFSNLIITDVDEENSGVYECHVAAFGVNITETFNVIVKPPGMLHLINQLGSIIY